MTVEELERIAAVERQNERKFNHHIFVCTAAGCLSSNADAVRDALRQEVLESGMQNSCQVKGVGCMGLCSAGPLVYVEPDSILYAGVTPEDVPEIVSALGTGNGVAGHPALRDRYALLREAAEDRARELGQDRPGAH